MIKTEEKYSDGSFVYMHDCPKCGEPNSARGPKRKASQCSDCLLLARRINVLTNVPSAGHGLTHDKNYWRWGNMKQRCTNPNHPRYSDWGGRGIEVCQEWIDSPENYIRHVEKLENANRDGYSLDRIENDGNYEPGNLRWATFSEQSINQRERRDSE